MNIWIDICHIPQYNFYRPLMMDLAKRGHEVYVTVLGRGRTPQIMQHELAGTPIHVDIVLFKLTFIYLKVSDDNFFMI